jgi:hypothetical protein
MIFKNRAGAGVTGRKFQKWLIFRSNLSGANQVYAVELKKAEGQKTSR